MKWFKHDASANRDDKLGKVLLKYGADGYALYWLCLELIADRLDADNASFELRHDAEILGSILKVDTLRVEEIMKYFVMLKLFECDSGAITCYKLGLRLDRSTARNPDILMLIDKISTDKYRQVQTSTDKSRQIRLDKIRIDKNKYSYDFETLWTQYPKKTDKANAMRAFNARMRDGVELSLLANCLRVYLADIKKNRTDPKYVMALTRFLGGRYTEYMPKPEKEIVCTPIDPEMMALVRKANGDKQEDVCATL